MDTAKGNIRRQKGRTRKVGRNGRGMKWTSPAVVTVLLGALGLGVHLIQTWINDVDTRDLEERKLQKELIVSVKNKPTRKQACEDLQYFLRVGVLRDRKGNIVNETCYPAGEDTWADQQSSVPNPVYYVVVKDGRTASPNAVASGVSSPATPETGGIDPGTPIGSQSSDLLAPVPQRFFK